MVAAAILNFKKNVIITALDKDFKQIWWQDASTPYEYDY